MKFGIYISGNDFMENLYDYGTLFWYCRIQGTNENILILWPYASLIVIDNVEPKYDKAMEVLLACALRWKGSFEIGARHNFQHVNSLVCIFLMSICLFGWCRHL